MNLLQYEYTVSTYRILYKIYVVDSFLLIATIVGIERLLQKYYLFIHWSISVRRKFTYLFISHWTHFSFYPTSDL